MVRASDCQYTSCNYPRFDSQHPSAQWNLRSGRWRSVEKRSPKKILKETFLTGERAGGEAEGV